MNDYIKTLYAEFELKRNPDIATSQKEYLRNKFEHFGLKTPVRRAIQKPFFEKEILPKKGEAVEIVKYLWTLDYREFHHFGQELLYKYKKYFEEIDIDLFEYMIVNQSWWDTVDFIATKLVFEYFETFPHQEKEVIERWLKSNDIWLQRSILIFQLNRKKSLNEEMLVDIITELKNVDEFFIQKAIGWTLRSHSRFNPEWVETVVDECSLTGLARKEALRLIQSGRVK